VDPVRRRQPLQPLAARGPGGGACRVISTPSSNTSSGLRGDSAGTYLSNGKYCAAGINRLDGPALPPHGKPDVYPSLERLNERLERLAFGRRPEGHEAPPLATYTTTSTEYGELVRATEEYVRWFRRTYPAAGPEDRVSQPTPCPSPEGYGGTADLTAL
jgi:hypothetical protein